MRWLYVPWVPSPWGELRASPRAVDELYFATGRSLNAWAKSSAQTDLRDTFEPFRHVIGERLEDPGDVTVESDWDVHAEALFVLFEFAPKLAQCSVLVDTAWVSRSGRRCIGRGGQLATAILSCSRHQVRTIDLYGTTTSWLTTW